MSEILILLFYFLPLIMVYPLPYFYYKKKASNKFEKYPGILLTLIGSLLIGYWIMFWLHFHVYLKSVLFWLIVGFVFLIIGQLRMFFYYRKISSQKSRG